MKKFFLSALATIVLVNCYAQDSTSLSRGGQQPPRNKKAEKRDRINNMMRMEEEGDLIFNKHNIFGVRLATDGYGINFEKGRYKTPSRTLLYQFEFNEKKSNKEHKLNTSPDGYSSSFVPYKLNNFYAFKVAIGEQRLLGGKGNKNGVAVTYLYTGGVSLALLKPYYVDVVNVLSGESTKKTWTDVLADTTSNDLITGAAGPFVGWGHLSVKPGLNAKAAMRFDYGRLNQTVTAIEVGVTGEFYFGKIPIVMLVPQHNLFLNAYVQIMFGSRK